MVRVLGKAMGDQVQITAHHENLTVIFFRLKLPDRIL